jgi:hypothetical protein
MRAPQTQAMEFPTQPPCQLDDRFKSPSPLAVAEFARIPVRLAGILANSATGTGGQLTKRSSRSRPAGIERLRTCSSSVFQVHQIYPHPAFRRTAVGKIWNNLRASHACLFKAKAVSVSSPWPGPVSRCTGRAESSKASAFLRGREALQGGVNHLSLGLRSTNAGPYPPGG